jgi:hypothetical protein
MTDEEYGRLLRALAAKHVQVALRELPPDFVRSTEEALKRVTQAAQLYTLSQQRADPHLVDMRNSELRETLPIKAAMNALNESRIIEALEDAGPVVFTELRRSAIPEQDFQYLREAGFSADEVEILIESAIRNAHYIVGRDITKQLATVPEAFDRYMKYLDTPEQSTLAPRKKRKLFTALGRLLGGSIIGIGNVLVATSTIAAPNPATVAGAIASGAAAVSMLLQAAGDWRGE